MAFIQFHFDFQKSLLALLWCDLALSLCYLLSFTLVKETSTTASTLALFLPSEAVAVQTV